MVIALITLLALVVHATPATKSNDCTFHIDNSEFNLCPILHTEFKLAIEEETPPTHTSYTYGINLGGQLERDVTLPRDLQCVQGTQICLTVINTRLDHPNEPIRILQVIPIAKTGIQPTARMADELGENKDVPLQLTFRGGIYNDRKQKASFFFHCDHDIEEPTKPTFLWRFNGTHAFSWNTKHACPKPFSPNEPPTSQDPPLDSDPPQYPPKDPESHTEPTHVRSSPSLTFPLIWKLLSIICLLQLAMYILFLSRRRQRRREQQQQRHYLIRPQFFRLFRSFVSWPPLQRRTQRDYTRLEGTDFEYENDQGVIPLTPWTSEIPKRSSSAHYGSL